MDEVFGGYKAIALKKGWSSKSFLFLSRFRHILFEVFGCLILKRLHSKEEIFNGKDIWPVK